MVPIAKKFHLLCDRWMDASCLGAILLLIMYLPPTISDHQVGIVAKLVAMIVRLSRVWWAMLKILTSRRWPIFFPSHFELVNSPIEQLRNPVQEGAIMEKMMMVY